MQSITVIARDNLSESIASAVRSMILDGRIPAGQRLNEVHLAQRLGVSRTPLREALARLAAEGALDSTPRLGYFVRPLTLDEFEQIYDIRPILDPEALRLAGVPVSARIDRLEKLNRKLAVARDAETAIALDDEWHRDLVGDCPNKVLLDLIDNIILRTRRYETALMRETKNVIRATEDHVQILSALRRGDLATACQALKQNMQSGREPIIEWLKRRGASQRG